MLHKFVTYLIRHLHTLLTAPEPILGLRGRRLDKPKLKLECGPMSNVMVALPNTGGALFSKNASKFG